MKSCEICGADFEESHTCSRTSSGEIIRVASFEKWEEFEDTIILTRENEKNPYKVFLLGKSIQRLFDRYFKLAWGGTTNNNLETPVKIKARKGAILIEEVKR